jgi:hypothetical protein
MRTRQLPKARQPMSKYQQLVLLLLATCTGLLFLIAWVITGWYDVGVTP